MTHSKIQHWFDQERDFDKHAQYYADEPKAQELLREDKVIKEFFEVSQNHQSPVRSLRWLSWHEVEDESFIVFNRISCQLRASNISI